MTIKDGGHAFPQPLIETRAYKAGMSLRDYFAAQAIVASTSVFFGGDHDNTPAAESIARDAYLLADAMLAERDKEPA